jgi:hypothetical protein
MEAASQVEASSHGATEANHLKELASALGVVRQFTVPVFVARSQSTTGQGGTIAAGLLE